MEKLTKWLKEGYFHHHVFAEGFANKVFVKQAGKLNNPTLLLIHGFPTSSYDWQPIWDTLTAHFHVITLDMIGFGYSDKPTDFPYSFAKQADLIEDVLASLSVTDYHILSHDYGDTVAQELLARQQQAEGNSNAKIHSTILLNGGIFPEVIQPILIQKLLLSPMGFLIAKAMSYKAFKKNFDKICTVTIDDIELKKYWQLIQHNHGDRIFHKLIRYMTERKNNRERWVGALTTFDKPMCFINGEDDPISGLAMLQRYKELIPNSDTVQLKNIGHYPQVEAPQLVLDAAFTFWEKHQILV
ncbi:alpha/beta fold hydrolase [Shewanella donghaensis]|uniref:alpha/beta fold hydrolase n=1 Tax=Shewanella donghaensis TaxID=238836 RepID=UPI001183336D|nr:alpha/beta hydrolase [Shewanella donghaensis]